MKHTIDQIFEGLDCLTSRQHHCAECPFNPHPGMEWPYGCIKGQNDIITEVRQAFCYKAVAYLWWDELRRTATILRDADGFANQRQTADYILKMMNAIETGRRTLE